MNQLLDREEYIEQAYFFRALAERTQQNMATQDLIDSLRDELLSTTKLPMALEFLSAELRHQGVMGPAMRKLGHYFTPFQAFIVEESENDRGRMDFNIALTILQREAAFRAESITPQAIFIYQFEVLARNRLRYDPGLDAVSRDPIFDASWHAWIQTVRRQVGLVDFADMVYVRSEYYQMQRNRRGLDVSEPEAPILFGEKEGKIALANRRKDPVYLFMALQRHLGYPAVPRPAVPDESKQILPLLVRQVERIETRLKLLEEENRGGLDITKFYGKDNLGPPLPEGDD